MQLTTWRAVAAHYRHIYLAPHMDDAALSCGGAMAQQAAAGEATLVVTVCAGSPDPAGPFNALAEEMHREYGVPGGEAVALRLREDAAALALLNADLLWLPYLDAIYRLPDRYYSNETIFGPVAPEDPLAPHVAALLLALAHRCPQATLYVPLGVGNHVDHQAALWAGLAAHAYDVPLLFYEDFPYAGTVGALEQRLAALEVPFAPEVVALDAASFERKLDAIDAYTTQVERIFGGSASMREAARHYGASIAPVSFPYGERLWRLTQ